MSDEPETPQAPQEPAGVDLTALKAEAHGEGGRFVRGNLAAVRHGQRSALLLEHPVLADAHRETAAQITADLGGPDALSTLKAHGVREAARLSLMVDSVGADLLAKGLLTKTGKTRAAVQTYALLLDRLLKVMGTLGLERRVKAAPDLAALMTQTERS